jgi:DNA-binding CsgD family transcriptional regulator
VARLRDAAHAAMAAAAPASAARLLRRALAEPPEPAVRVGVLREVAGAEASAGLATARDALAEALRLTADVRERAEIALQAAEADAALFRWVEAVDVITTALAELDAADVDLAGQLEALLVVCAMHDARRAAAVGPTLQRLALRDLAGAPAEGRAVAVGMGMVLAGAPASDAAAVLTSALADGPDDRVENWDARAALWWSLITAEDFDDVERSLARRADEVDRSGSARALVAVYSTRGLLELRRGRLAEGDAAARIAMGVLQAGDFAPGLVFGVTVLADLCVEAGDLDQAAELLALLPDGRLEPGVGTVLIPAARGRLQLAQRQWEQARRSFETCSAMFSPAVWGLPMCDVGYVHAGSSLALALLGLGQTDAAAHQAEAELHDVRGFGGRRAVGVSSRVAGLVAGGERGEQLLIESVDALRASPARLELAKSLVELGAACRRSGRRRDAREWLAEGLELAAACGAPPLVRRARDELLACGARPRRAWRHGVASLTPSERRVAELAAAGRTNRDIAIELYVTRKTVEGHLARVYTKLQIPGRPELARVLDAKDEGADPLADGPRGE